MREKGFLAITFLISWGIQLGLMLTNHMQGGMFNAFYPLIMAAPAFAALATKYAIKEPLWYNFWLKPEGRKTVQYSLVGWLAPVGLIAIGAVLYFLIFPGQFDGGMTAQIEHLRASQDLNGFSDEQIRSTLRLQIGLNVIMAPIYYGLPAVGEEIGWRGYYLNMLCEKHPKWKAVLINGLTWGIWYMPMAVSLGLFYGKDYPGYPVVGCIGVLIYYIVFGIIYSFLTLKTHSCIPAIFANACVATMSGVGTLFMKDSQKANVFLNPMPSSIIGGIGFIVVAAVIMYLLIQNKVEPAEAKLIEKKANYNLKKGAPTGSLKSRLQNEHLKKDR